MMVDRLLTSIPDGKLIVFKSGLFGRKNVWLIELQVLTLQVSVFLAVREGAPCCYCDHSQWPHLTLMSGS